MNKKQKYKVGEQVEILQVPPDIKKMPKETQDIFSACIGRIFKIHAIAEDGLLELEVGKFANPSEKKYMHSIWIEPQYTKKIKITKS